MPRSTGAGTGPLAAPPNFQAPIVLYTDFNALGANKETVFTPQTVVGGSQDAPDFYNVFVQNRDWIDTDKVKW